MKILNICPIDTTFDRHYIYYVVAKPSDKHGFITINEMKHKVLFVPSERILYVSEKTTNKELVKTSFLITLDYFRTSVKKFYDKFLFEKTRTMEQMMAEEVFSTIMSVVFFETKQALEESKKEILAFGG